MRNPYEILGVASTASADEIRGAYRKLAKKLHPDLNPGDKTAEERFKEVAAAHDLLSDEDKRRRFDAGEIDASGAERPPQRPFYRDYATADHTRPSPKATATPISRTATTISPSFCGVAPGRARTGAGRTCAIACRSNSLNRSRARASASRSRMAVLST